jgi:RNA polymerase sigma-54 factor
MSFAQELSMAPQLGLAVTPALVTFTEMLMLPFPAMQSVIEEELCSNAALERLESGECPICRGVGWSRCPVCATPSMAAAPAGRQSSAPLSERAGAESDADALLRAVRLESPDRNTDVLEYLVYSLDCHGLLDRSCAELATEIGVDESVVATALALIRRTGPPGVGATNVNECLVLQLEALHLEDDCAALARAVITDHLPALARGYFASIATALGATTGQIREVLDLIRRRLRPYPAFNGNVTADPCPVVPDVVVRAHDEIAGEFVVELVEPALTRLGVRASPDRGASMSHARSFLAQLRDRWETLRRVAEFTIEWQKAFFLDGPAGLRPLTRAEVAAALDVHESTVSRTVADKFALLPDRTIFPMSGFFGVGGGIDGALRRLLEAPDRPLSDQRLTNLLRDAGYPIARRTVTKHRARLGFMSTSRR